MWVSAFSKDKNNCYCMREDAFSKCHPAVNALFFVGVIGFCTLIQHPFYLLAGLLVSCIYYTLLNGKKVVRIFTSYIFLFLFICMLNPIFNTRGSTILFYFAGRPYTYEALMSGVVVASVLVQSLIWLGCCNKVLTSDKFFCLFGALFPTITLLIVMVFRLIPNLIFKTKESKIARSSILKDVKSNKKTKRNFIFDMAVIGAVMSWALDAQIATADSMRARGYNTIKRTSFNIYRINLQDIVLSFILICLMSTVIVFSALGSTYVEFFPMYIFASMNGGNIIGFFAYLGYITLPIILYLKESVDWNNSKYII